jgi:hypothetical protein
LPFDLAGMFYFHQTPNPTLILDGKTGEPTP